MTYKQNPQTFIYVTNDVVKKLDEAYECINTSTAKKQKKKR